MLLLADVVCAIAAVLLLMMTLRGRPMNGEAFVGAHRITGPFALAFTLGTGLVLVAAPLPSTLANVALGLLLPGTFVAMTFLPFVAYGRRGAWLVKLLMPFVVATPFGLGHGGAVHAMMPWFAAAVLALLSLTTTWSLVGQPLRRWCSRLWHALIPRPHQPSQWELGQMEFHRDAWQKVPEDANVRALLAHARSLAPEVRAACHQRLAAREDLDQALAAELLGANPGEALWYLVNGYPRSRQPFAPTLTALLARLRATWPAKMREDPHPRPWTGDLMLVLECSVAVLMAGGDVRAELRSWQAELATMPKFRGQAKELARWLKKAG